MWDPALNVTNYLLNSYRIFLCYLLDRISSVSNKKGETQHILSSSNSFTAVIRWGVFSRGANGSKSRTPLVAEQKGFPGECPTISKQSPGWISSLALKPRWRMRIWVAYEKKMKDEVSCFQSRDTSLRSESVNFEIVHKQKVGGPL